MVKRKAVPEAGSHTVKGIIREPGSQAEKGEEWFSEWKRKQKNMVKTMEAPACRKLRRPSALCSSTLNGMQITGGTRILTKEQITEHCEGFAHAAALYTASFRTARQLHVTELS